MAAPVAVTRTAPTGFKMKQGWRTLVTFTTAPSVSLWEKTVKPPGVDGGDAVDQTTMWNDVWTTAAPQVLKKMTDVSFKAAYDPQVYNTLLTLINVETTITILFPNKVTSNGSGGKLAFYGFLKMFEPDELQRAQQPEAAVTIVPTNWDHFNKVEAGPVYTAPT